jgi:hypothetical protein
MFEVDLLNRIHKIETFDYVLYGQKPIIDIGSERFETEEEAIDKVLLNLDNCISQHESNLERAKEIKSDFLNALFYGEHILK